MAENIKIKLLLTVLFVNVFAINSYKITIANKSRYVIPNISIEAEFVKDGAKNKKIFNADQELNRNKDVTFDIDDNSQIEQIEINITKGWMPGKTLFSTPFQRFNLNPKNRVFKIKGDTQLLIQDAYRIENVKLGNNFLGQLYFSKNLSKLHEPKYNEKEQLALVEIIVIK